MRSSKEPNFNRRGLRTKIKKKRNGKSHFLPFGSPVSDNNILHINEALRKNKSASNSKGSWKVLPKDSCEVYRVRRRRQQNQRRDGSLSEEQVGRKQSKKQKRRHRCSKKRRAAGKNERRPSSESTMRSTTDSQTTNSSRSVCSYCARSCDMES